MYGDDTAITYSSKNKYDINCVLNEELQMVSEWMYNNKLTLNASKTKVMTFGTSQKNKKGDNLTVKIKDDILENVTEFKHLGVWFDQYLRWDTHIDKTAANISQRIGVM